MVSQLFVDLYEKAADREHRVLSDTEYYWRQFDMKDFPAAVRLATEIFDAHIAFLEDLNHLARRKGRDFFSNPPCPECGSPVCTHVAPVTLMPVPVDIFSALDAFFSKLDEGDLPQGGP